VSYATIFPVSGQSNQVKLTELAKYQIIDAKYENGVLVVIGTKITSKKSLATKSKYDRFVFRMSADYHKYDFWMTEDVTYTGINFTVADHGVAVLLNEDEKLEAFSKTSGSSTTPKRFDDDALDADMKLCHRGSKILFAKGKKLYSISMK
jgi:subtilisin family serine protease